MSSTRSSMRERVVTAGADLLARDGREALSTRAVAAAAGTQAPTIYRLFGDKQGLLDAIAAHGFAEYIATKQSTQAGLDPLQWLRDGWDEHVAFGLERPAFYVLVFGDPRPDGSPVQRTARNLLRARLEPLARDGRLTTSIDRATHIMEAGGIGVVLTLLTMPEDQRDSALSATVRDRLTDAITLARSARPQAVGAPAPLAVALTQALRDDQNAGAMTPAEHALLLQWLDRLSRPATVG